MCDERERLIGYVYDECDAGERVEVQRHLESCAECRAEIAGLRSVRVDLQAWEVPDHESVWRPFAPAPAAPWWSQVPRWAMAAAAGVVFASGAAGGAVMHTLLPHAQTVVAAADTQSGPAVVTAAELTALEQRMEARWRTELDELNGRVQLATSRPLPLDVEASLHRAFDQQLADLRLQSERQLDVISSINANLGQVQKGFDARHGLLKTRVENLAQVLEQGR